jgi:hypothetical protein
LKWQVCGRVVDQEGRPVSGAQVKVLSRDFTWDYRLAPVSTDESGCFQVVYHENDFRDLIEAAPDLYMKVEDQAGKQMYLSKRMRYEAGRSEYFHIVLH